ALVDEVPAEGEVGVDERQAARGVELGRLRSGRDEAHSLQRDAGVLQAGLEPVARVVAGGIPLRAEHRGQREGEGERRRYGARPAGEFHQAQLRVGVHGSASICRIRPISARCVVSTSFARTDTSTSWAARGDAYRSATMVRAPSWWRIMYSRNIRSKAGPRAASSFASSSLVSMPCIVMVRHDEVSGTNWPFARSQSCMSAISPACDRSIFCASFTSRASASRVGAMRDMWMAWAWWAIIPCMKLTSASVYS